MAKIQGFAISKAAKFMFFIVLFSAHPLYIVGLGDR
jgi:hypothetical protein